MGEVSENYTHSLPADATIDVEPHLQGKEYDPYIRRLMYDGLGVGPVSGRFQADAPEWRSCPQIHGPSLEQPVQDILPLRKD